MKTDDVEEYARSYIDSALESQERLGESSKVSTEDYENAVRRVVTAFEDLKRVRQRSRGSEPVASGQ